MNNMTLAQAMEWFATTDTHDLVRGLQAGHVLAAEIRRRDGETREAFRAGYLAVVSRDGEWSFDSPTSRDLEPDAWEAWQKREGE